MLRFASLRSVAVAGSLACFACFPVVAWAGSVEHLAVQRLLAGHGMALQITADATTGAIVAIRSADVTLTDGRVRPAAAACEWLQANAEAFGLRTGADQLQVERDEPLPAGAHRVLIRQYWNGFPVESGDARCIVNAQGQLHFVASGFLSALAAPVEPRVARAAALAAAAGALEVSLARVNADAALWVRRRDGRDRLAWEVHFAGGEGPAPSVWVDAESGEVLETERGCANAVGLVYPDDPRGPLEERPLANLETDDALVSSQFAIRDEQHAQAVPLGPGGDFRYPPSDVAFDQVNVYWHAQHYLEFMAGLGYAGPPDSLIVRLNMPLEPNVALTDGRYVSFGRPIPGFSLDVARCQDIIYHELTHAVLFGFGILPTGASREAASLHEGLADYFSCALTGDPAVGEWLYVTFPNGCTRVDQPPDPWNYAHFDQVSFGGGSIASPWGNGMIVSSGLWDLRHDIGSSADSLVLEAMAYLPSSPIWTQLANALLQADADHHALRFRAAIVRVMLQRGIDGSVGGSLQIAGPKTLVPGVEARFDAVPCCGGQAGEYRWRIRSWCRGVPCGDWRDAGTGSALDVALDDDAEIELSATSLWGRPLADTLFVGVRTPTLVVEGPTRVAQHAQATWKARVTGMGPMSVSWTRQLLQPGQLPMPSGTGLEQTLTVDMSMQLEARLVDGWGRVVTQGLIVEAFVDHPPSGGPPTLHLSQSLDAGARHAETTIGLPRGSPLKLVVYDVRGRARLTLWDGPAARGTHIVRWDAGGLEPGVYFMRLLAEPTGTLLRFVVVR